MSRATTPVSVVIPVHNREALLPRAVASAKAQRPHPPAEIIVVDDGSSDGSATVARQLGARVILHPENRGQAAARNSGLDAAAHEWVALLDSDDEWLPIHLTNLWGMRENHAFVSSAAIMRHADGNPDHYHGPTSPREMEFRSPRDLLRLENIVAPSCTMLSADLTRRAGGFKTELDRVEDLDLWVRLLELAPARLSSEPTVLYHVHENQLSTDEDRTLRAHRQVIESYRGRRWWDPKLLHFFDGREALVELRQGLSGGEWARAARTSARIASHPYRLSGAISRRMRDNRVNRHAQRLPRR